MYVGDAFLVMMDVDALYSNIDHSEGIKALRHYLQSREKGLMPPKNFFLQLTQWTLHNNVFYFRINSFSRLRVQLCMFISRILGRKCVHGSLNLFRERYFMVGTLIYFIF